MQQKYMITWECCGAFSLKKKPSANTLDGETRLKHCCLRAMSLSDDFQELPSELAEDNLFLETIEANYNNSISPTPSSTMAH